VGPQGPQEIEALATPGSNQLEQDQTRGRIPGRLKSQLAILKKFECVPRLQQGTEFLEYRPILADHEQTRLAEPATSPAQASGGR
jgi:hypothetical protein